MSAFNTFIIGGAAALVVGIASAQQTQQPPPTDPAAASSPHQREVTGEAGSKPGEATDSAAFVDKAAQGGMAEVEMARLALSKSSNPDIQAFANRMIRDHEMANEELLAIAERNQIEAPHGLDAAHKSMVEKLGFKNGKEFDAAYARQMVKDHQEDVALFQGATSSKNADISGFARKTLPTLKQHAAAADKLPRGS